MGRRITCPDAKSGAGESENTARRPVRSGSFPREVEASNPGQHDFSAGEGLYTHMKALRPDEDRLSAIHSVYVDQWDWERVMGDGERHVGTLKSTVEAISPGSKRPKRP